MSGPLTAVADLGAARAFYESVASVAKECGWDLYLPHHSSDPERHSDVSPEVVYLDDLKALTIADVIIADMSIPSLGVGAELGIASMQNKNIIGLYPIDVSPSRFVLGMLAVSRRFHVIQYGSLNQCLEQLRTVLLKMHSNLISEPKIGLSQ